jgi:hypothetical protein
VSLDEWKPRFPRLDHVIGSVLWVPLVCALMSEHLSHAAELPVFVVVVAAIAGAVLGVGVFAWELRLERIPRLVVFAVTFSALFALLLVGTLGSETIRAAIALVAVGSSIGAATGTVEAYIRNRRDERQATMIPPAPPIEV